MKIFLLLILGLGVFFFSACSDDEEDISGILDSMDMYVNGQKTSSQKFTYDVQGRLIKVTEPVFGDDYISEVNYTFEYADDKVTVVIDEGSDEVETYVFYLSGNKADRYTLNGHDAGEFTYDGNRLKSWKDDGLCVGSYTWSGNNIVAVTWPDPEDDFEGEISPYENKANIDYNVLFSNDIFLNEAAFAGVLGDKTKNVILPKGYNFEIQTKQGYITQVKRVVEEEGETYSMIVKFNYK